MNFKKIAAVAAASALAVSAMAVSASAYDIDLDLGIGWSANTIIPAEEFDGATTDSVFTITYTADTSIADIDGQNYWCIKTMVNDTGWPFCSTFIGPTLSEAKDTYVLDPEGTEFKFMLTAEDLETLQTTGLALMGHGAVLNTFSFSNDETLPGAEAPAEEEAAPAPAAGDVEAAVDSSKGSPDTGIGDVAVFGGIALAAAAGIVVSRKRK